MRNRSRQFQLFGLTLVLASITLMDSAWAQDAATDPAAATSQQLVLSVIDEPFYLSPRSTAMGGATITVADDLDAAFANPAGIGGLGWGKKDPPYLRKLMFPLLGVGANVNSAGLYHEFRKQGGSKDSTMGKAIVDAHSGDRQYARANSALGVVFGRTMLVPFSDVQLAATAKDDGTEAINVHYRSMSGIGYGFSAQDNDDRFSLGYFGYAASRTETTGDFSYTDFIDSSARKKAISDNSTKYSGVGNNVGFIWHMAKTAKPTLGFHLKNIGDTKFKASGSANDLVLKQDLNAGFSLSPQVGKSGAFNFVVEADRLLDHQVTFTKKYHVGLELNLGGIGSYATFSLRGGYTDAGGSGGLGLNLGLLSLEVSAYSVDIGATNEKVVERRYLGTMMVNIAEF